MANVSASFSSDISSNISPNISSDISSPNISSDTSNTSRRRKTSRHTNVVGVFDKGLNLAADVKEKSLFGTVGDVFVNMSLNADVEVDGAILDGGATTAMIGPDVLE